MSPPKSDEANAIVGPDPEIDALAQEVLALGAKYPPPNRAEVMADWKWVYERTADDTLNPGWRYMNCYMAVYNREIVGSGQDYLKLMIEMSRKFGLHPERFVIVAAPSDS